MKDGGSAFPVFDNYGYAQEPDYGCASLGMTLRDWFAGQYLSTFTDESTDFPAIAHVCYEMADAMIARREADNRKEAEKA
jgi:hypothetical protein